MKKLFYTLIFVLCAGNAMAEKIIVIDNNGIVTQQITTSSPQIVHSVVTTQPAVTVVRESPTVSNSYYYDNYSTGTAILAGVTTAVVGALLFDGFHIHHHKSHAPAIKHHSKPAPAPSHHGSGHHSSHKPKR